MSYLHDAQLRHARYYETVLRAANESYLQNAEDSEDGVVHFELDWTNIESAQAWVEALAETSKEAAELCLAYPDAGLDLLRDHLHPTDRLHWHESAFSAATRLNRRHEQGRRLTSIGNVYLDLDQVELAIDFYQQALVIAIEVEDAEGKQNALGNLGDAYKQLDQLPQAIEHYKRSLTLAHGRSDRSAEAATLLDLGLTHAENNEEQRAIDYYKAALNIARQLDDRELEADVLLNRAIANGNLGEKRRSREDSRRALKIFRKLGDRAGEAEALEHLAIGYMESRPERALDSCLEALEILEELDDVDGESRILQAAALLMIQLADLSRAVHFLARRLELVRGLEDEEEEERALYSLGNACMLANDFSQAVECWNEYLDHVGDDPEKAGEAWRGLVTAYVIGGDPQRGVQACEQAIDFARASGDRFTEGHALYYLGSSRWRIGEVEGARDAAQRSLLLARELGNQMLEYGAHTVLGDADKQSGELRMAIEHFENALNLAREIELAPGAHAPVLRKLSEIHKELGEDDRAKELFAEYLSLAPESSEAYVIDPSRGVPDLPPDVAEHLFEKDINLDDLLLSQGKLIIRRPQNEAGPSLWDTFDLGNANVLEEDKSQLKKKAKLDHHETSLKVAKHYVSILRRAQGLYDHGGEAMQRGLALFEAEWPNIESSHAWVVQHADQDQVAAELCKDFAVAAGSLLWLRLQPEQQIEWIEAGLPAARSANDKMSEMSLTQDLGVKYRNSGQPELAVHYLEQALELVRELKLGMEHRVIGSLGNAYNDLGNFQRALESHQEALALARERSNSGAVATHLVNLGNTYDYLEDFGEAHKCYEQGLQMFRELGDRNGEGHALAEMGMSYLNAGNTEAAIDVLHDALSVVRETGDLPFENLALTGLARAYKAAGDLDQSIEIHREALRKCRETGDLSTERSVLSSLADLYQSAGRVDDLIKLHEESVALAHNSGDAALVAHWLTMLGTAYTEAGDLDGAIELHHQALELAREVDERATEGDALGNLGNVYRTKGDINQAKKFLEQASLIFREIGDAISESMALSSLREIKKGEKPGRFVAPSPYHDTDPEKATQLNLKYQQELAAWERLPFWKRLVMKKPMPPVRT